MRELRATNNANLFALFALFADRLKFLSSDSGTVRDVTERAETIEAGSNILSGAEPEMILQSVRLALETSAQWNPPAEYVEREVARRVAKIVLGYQHPAAARGA